ncbi:hypothetical protein [Streptomyces sp. LS1784]|uniref:hypothetical protein n=1 Tax=Streptomyces sp. LS1784 TaxID=2851533 RepID=UPI001CCDC6B2|nr:hypothetical protein [Streptomyces sp. LS1784]
MSTLTIGAWHTAELHGIAGPWVIHGYATIWDLTTGPDGTQCATVEVSTPGSRDHGPHYAYATGLMSALTDDRIELMSIVTPQPGPSRIVLGAEPECLLGDADAEHHQARAVSILTEWQPLPDGDGPLGVSALSWLARAVQRADDSRAAGADRDRLVLRLDAGGVPRDLIARTIGRDPSRIAQLRRRQTAA